MRRLDLASFLDAFAEPNVILRVIVTALFVALAMSAWALVARSAGTVGVNKAFTPSSVNFGTDSTLTITLLNSDPTASVNITTMTDNMPAGLSVDLGQPATTTCAGGAVGTTASSVTLTGGVIPQAPDTFNPGTCTVTLSVYGSATQNYVNTIPAGGLVTSAGSNLTPGSATLQVTDPGNISVAVSVLPTQVPETASPVYTVTITNPNKLALTNVTIPGTLTSPVGSATLHIVSAVSSCGGSVVVVNGSPTTFTVTGATIPANGTCTVTVTVSVNGQFTNAQRTQRLTVAAGTVTSAQGVTNSTSAQADVTYFPITPTLSKTFTPNVTVAGATVLLTLNVVSRDTVALTNFGFTDVLPGGLTIAAPPNLANSCGGPAGSISGTTTAVVSGLTISPAASLGASGPTCAISFNVVVPAAPPSQTPTNTISGSSLTNDQGLKGLSNPAAVLTVGPTPTPQPSFSKAFSASTVARGINSTASINIINPAGGLALHNVSVTDNLPAGMVIFSAPTANANCGAPVLSGAPGGTLVTMTGGTIAAGAHTCTITVVVTPTVTQPFPVTLHNDIPIGGITAVKSDSTPVSNTSIVEGNLIVTHGLTLTHYFSPTGSVTVGVAPIKDTISVEDKITSTAASDDHNLSAVFTLNSAGSAVVLAAVPNFTYVCTKGSVLTFTPGAGGLTYTAASADFVFKDVCTITYSVTSLTAGTFTAGKMTVASTEDNLQTLSGSNNVIFVAPGNINVNKTFTPNAIPAAGISHMQITLSNDAHAAPGGIVFNETGVGLTDNLPAGMSVAAIPNASTTCVSATLTAVAGASSVSISGASLPSRTAGDVLQPCTITVDVTATAPGNLTNTIPAGSITSGSGATNAFAVSVSLTSSANIAVSKAFLLTTIPPAATTWVALTFTNGSNIPDTIINLTDNLPSGIVVKDVVSQPPPQGGAPPNCGATVTGVAGGSSFSVGNFILAAAAKCVTYVAVTTAAPVQFGTFNNTIPAGSISSSTGLSNLQPTTASITVAAVSLSLGKLVRNVTTGGANGTTANASPGDTLLYTLTYTNTSPFGEANLAIKDTLPPNTTFVSATCGTLGGGLTACTPSGPTLGVVTWTLTGTLNAGASGTVFLTVTVQ